MKLFIVALLFAAAAARSVENRGRNHGLSYSTNVTEMIVEYGYPVQNFTVQTSDGYILDVIRIPGGADEKEQFEQKQKKMNRDDVSMGKPAVVLMHGLQSSAEDFVYGGPTEGLAFVFADHGYDVYLANARGNTYGRKHTTLNPEKDSAFWRFCWHHIGTKDLPAIIDEVLSISQQEKVYFIGHMQGTTAFYVMASEMPQYNNKIEKMISLGPVAYMKGANSQMLKAISKNDNSKSWLIKNIGMNEFHPTNEFMLTVGEADCMSRGINERICQNSYFLMNGYDSKYMNMTTLEEYAARLPAGASSLQVLHYAQLVKSGRFEMYAPEGSSSVREYDLSKITVPMAMVYTSNDMFSSMQDVRTLINKLPNVVADVNMQSYSSNIDLIFGKNVDSVVYQKYLELLK